MQSFRKFRIWDFSISHGQLLLRSPKQAADESNIDIAFVGVEYVALPASMAGVAIVEPEDADRRAVESALGRRVESKNIFVVVCAGARHAVVATAMAISENKLGALESSLERF